MTFRQFAESRDESGFLERIFVGDAAALRVYGDWLQEASDPLGGVISYYFGLGGDLGNFWEAAPLSVWFSPRDERLATLTPPTQIVPRYAVVNHTVLEYQSQKTYEGMELSRPGRHNTTKSAVRQFLTSRFVEPIRQGDATILRRGAEVSWRSLHRDALRLIVAVFARFVGFGVAPFSR